VRNHFFQWFKKTIFSTVFITAAVWIGSIRVAVMLPASDPEGTQFETQMLLN
jgi:hypothetical protein